MKARTIHFKCLRSAFSLPAVAGSRAYGTHTHESDEDTRGIYAVRADRYLDLDTPLPQLADERGNTVYFSLRRFIELLAVANPNVLELLFMPGSRVMSAVPTGQISVDEGLDLRARHPQHPDHLG